MRFYEKAQTKEDVALAEGRRKKAGDDLERLIQQQNRLKSQMEAEKKLISDEMDSLFHRLEALRLEKAELEKERDELLRSDWALEIEHKGHEAADTLLKAQKAIQDASDAAEAASDAKTHFMEAMKSLEAREETAKSAREEVRLSRESLEMSRKEFMEERKRTFALVDAEREEAKRLLEKARSERKENEWIVLGAEAVRKQSLALQEELAKEKRRIESRQQALKLAIEEAKRKGVQ